MSFCDTERNLLQETLDVLMENNKKPSDVDWVGTSDGKCVSTFEEFAEEANFEYDAGYGGRNINSLLVVVGRDFWLERHEYDGAEWWEFKALPIQKKKSKKLTKENILSKY